MPMCLLQTFLQIQHAYALEYDKPWIIEHYIQILNMLVFSRWLPVYCTPPFFYKILEKEIFFLQIPNM